MDTSEKSHSLSRRRWFAGAGAVGAVAAVAAVAPKAVVQTEAAQAPAPGARPGGGYRLSEHVKRYYQTTRV